VKAQASSQCAYLKPTTVCPENHPRAAYEKIAADIASELGLRVPPVLLYRRNNCPAGQEPRACVSLVTHEEYWEWQQVLSLGPGVARALAQAEVARSCGIIGLDTLIGNTDRDNARNAIFGFTKSAQADSSFFFLDHANSMNFGDRWKDRQWKAVTVPNMPQLLKDSVDKQILSETIKKIEGLPTNCIEDIVRRVPADYMSETHKDIVLNGLVERKTLVREPLAVAFDL